MKRYLPVEALFTPEGRMRPVAFWWEGRRIPVDRVLGLRRAASLKAGGAGLRYTVRAGGREFYLFYEENYRWFLEA